MDAYLDLMQQWLFMAHTLMATSHQLAILCMVAQCTLSPPSMCLCVCAHMRASDAWVVCDMWVGCQVAVCARACVRCLGWVRVHACIGCLGCVHVHACRMPGLHACVLPTCMHCMPGLRVRARVHMLDAWVVRVHIGCLDYVCSVCVRLCVCVEGGTPVFCAGVVLGISVRAVPDCIRIF